MDFVNTQNSDKEYQDEVNDYNYMSQDNKFDNKRQLNSSQKISLNKAESIVSSEGGNYFQPRGRQVVMTGG